METFYRRADRRHPGSADRVPRPALLAGLLLGLLPSVVAFGAEGVEQDPYQWSIAVAPSLFAPHMHELNDALQNSGVDALSNVGQTAGISTSVNLTGFQTILWGYGGRISLDYEFDEDLRGGLLFEVNDTYQRDTLPLTDTSTVSATCATCSNGFTTSTLYSVSEQINLPLVQLGASFQKVFHFDEEPDLRLYLGGWGLLGTLLDGTINGHVRNLNKNRDNQFLVVLRGQGWSAGVNGGLEYAVGRGVAVILESGYGWSVISNVEKWGVSFTSFQNSSPFRTASGKPIPLDFGGVFIRFGVRIAIHGTGEPD